MSGWIFDADERHPLASRRVPVVDSIFPAWKYEVALCVSADLPLWHGVEPDTDDSWQQRMMGKALDVDAGTNTVVLIKYPHGGWGYRRMTWTSGPVLVPAVQDAPQSLRWVLDRCFGHGDSQDAWAGSWWSWKKDHPDLFPVEADRG